MTSSPNDRRIVVVCRSGGRSAAVADTLRVAGYDAVNLTGGMCAWTAAGLAVVHPSVSKALDPQEAHRHPVGHGMVVHRAD